MLEVDVGDVGSGFWKWMLEMLEVDAVFYLFRWLITLQIHSRDQVARLKRNQLEKSLQKTKTKV